MTAIYTIKTRDGAQYIKEVHADLWTATARRDILRYLHGHNNVTMRLLNYKITVV